MVLFEAHALQEWADYISFLGRLLKVLPLVKLLIAEGKVNQWNIWTAGVTIIPNVPANSTENFGVQAFGTMSQLKAPVWSSPEDD